MPEIVIRNAPQDYQPHLKAADLNRNGKIDSAAEAKEAALSFCREEFSDCDQIVEYLRSERFPLTRRAVDQSLAERIIMAPGKNETSLRRSANLLGKLLLLEIKPKTKLMAVETLLKSTSAQEPQTLFAVFGALEDLAESDLPVSLKENVVAHIAAASRSDDKFRRILAVRALGEYAEVNISLEAKRSAIEHLILRLKDVEERIVEATLDSLHNYYVSKLPDELRTRIRNAIKAAKN